VVVSVEDEAKTGNWRSGDIFATELKQRWEKDVLEPTVRVAFVTES
jgi:hypothetical protein